MIEVSKNLVLLLVAFAFVAGIALGWGIFEIMEAKRLVAEHRRRREAIRTADELPELKVGDGLSAWKDRPGVLDRTRALTARPKWNHGDEDFLLAWAGIDPTRVATDEDRRL